MPFLLPSKQHQSTEGSSTTQQTWLQITATILNTKSIIQKTDIHTTPLSLQKKQNVNSTLLTKLFDYLKVFLQNTLFAQSIS